MQNNASNITCFDYDVTVQRMKTADEQTDTEIFYPFPGYELEVQTNGTEIEHITYVLGG